MNGAERLLRVMSKLVQQVQDVTDIVYGVVVETYPLRINIGDIQIDENFIIADEQVIYTMSIGESVRMLRTNHGQKFYILKVVDYKSDVDNSFMVWIPDITTAGDIVWSRVNTKITPRPSNIKGPQGKRGAAGPIGDPGVQGPDGYTGPKGERGDRGLPGITGAVGPKGDKGLSGTDGAKGATGNTGAKGATGDSGPGFPAGGTNGQVVIKQGTQDYTFRWADFLAGDMVQSEYDSTSEVKNAGGLEYWLDGAVRFKHFIFRKPDSDPYTPPLDFEDILIIYET